MLAALASAAMPETSMAGVCEHNRSDKADNAVGIDYAVVQDTAGRQYDVFVSSEPKGKKLLARRAKAAKVLAQSHEMSGLGFAVDRALAFSAAGTGSKTGKNSVLVSPHVQGEPRQLDLLTVQDAASVGTAIGAIHRQRTDFLTEAKYPAFTTGQIRAQLTGWIKRLQQAGHVPTAITSSWAKIIETDGLWSFSTTLTHGGFADGDFLFADSTITKVGNWQDVQVNDPARDLAWMFAKMDESHRNAMMNAYGGMMGSRIDDLILLRANLWLQMEQVGDFIEALGRADNTKILQFKAQVEHLAHQLTVVANKAAGAATAASAVVPPKKDAPSSAEERGSRDPYELEDDESDKTGSAEVTKLVEASDSTADRPVHFKPARSQAFDDEDDDRTDDKKPAAQSEPLYPNMPNPSSSATIILTEAEKNSGSSNDEAEAESQPGAKAEDLEDETGEKKVSWHIQYSQEDDIYSGKAETSEVDHEAPTALIPLLEREQQALHDAQMGLEEAEEKAQRERTASKTDIKAQDSHSEREVAESDIAKELDDAVEQDDTARKNAAKDDGTKADSPSPSGEVSTDNHDSNVSDDSDDTENHDAAKTNGSSH
ncbi:aminoglycoside phosphotransferase [Bifidobacterium sp. ESL0784]|uniref:phosphotransferase n=1 Tax=Bifidobacterium sp. ESL0784 TaxID=2983231 RepID=UPI0023FA011A|nr:phosphotransferase [Bifidobacterium sp. ESL0784]MDF7641675.1 aminoglycoside phosphotransferase [Bifidobacterium sp. ESL0784]